MNQPAQKPPQGIIVENRTNKKNSCRPIRTGFINLILINNEIFAQDRNRNLAGNVLQIVYASLEIIPFGQAGNSRCPSFFIGFRNCNIRKSGAISPFDGEALLTSQIKDNPSCASAFSKGNPCFCGADKAISFIISGEIRSLSAASRLATAAVISSSIIVCPLTVLLTAMQRFSVSVALPLSIREAASVMPSAMESALRATNSAAPALSSTALRFVP